MEDNKEVKTEDLKLVAGGGIGMIPCPSCGADVPVSEKTFINGGRIVCPVCNWSKQIE
ncbi:MAG: hypothetical protein K5870_01585 [Lachnospiraceae bacterium]|nr:hypothetical protein [Lachnospiraceae bacterium]